MEGNCVLIPDAIARQVGNIDTALVHNRGDFDYGLRAAQLGYGIWVAPGLYATCERDAVEWRTPRLPLRHRLGALHESKYALDQKVLVARSHYGPLWFLAPLAVYAYIFLSHPFGLLFSQRHTKRRKD
jgi:GT2 family glycosyltransferase